MKLELKNRAGGTGFQPVQFGILPNCVGTCEFTLVWAQDLLRSVSPVSGRMPETTGWKPVPPEPIEIFRLA